jgi:hypothetical protein
MNILCVASLSSCFDIHGKRELTLLAALRERGHTIDYIICDCLFSVCEGSAGKEYLTMRRCFHCQRHGKRRARQLGFTAKPLRGFHRFRDRLKARLFVSSLADNELNNSCYGDYQLGRWVISSIMTMYNISRYTPGNARFSIVYRRYIENALCEAWAVERYLNKKKYDRVIIFNGRMAYTKVVLELAQKRCIPTYIHEQGRLREHISLALNVGVNNFDLQRQFWNDWKDIPLTYSEIEKILCYLYKREQGDPEALTWYPFTCPPTNNEHLRKNLCIANDKKVWALFTSSIFEMAQIDGFNMYGFKSQNHWIEYAIGAAAKYPDVHLVIRVHPNLCTNNNTKVDDTEWRYFKDLKTRIKDNITIIEPHELFSTYDLMNLADVGLSYISTCGLEMAARGKPVCIGATTFYDSINEIDKAFTPKSLDTLFSKYRKIPHGFIDKQLKRMALRFWHSYIFKSSFPFHLVKQHHFTGGKFAFTSCNELAIGRDAILDHICLSIEQGISPLLKPNDEMRRRTTGDEDRFLEQ